MYPQLFLSSPSSSLCPPLYWQRLVGRSSSSLSSSLSSFRGGSTSTTTSSSSSSSRKGGRSVWQRHHQPHHPLLYCRHHFTYPNGPGTNSYTTLESLHALWEQRDFRQRGFTVGIGGPVGSGKTAMVWKLCQAWTKNENDHDDNTKSTTTTTTTTVSSTPLSLGVVTNDIFTQEDAQFLTRQRALPAHRIRAVETGGCPHAAIREDVSANLTALEELTTQIQKEMADTETTTSTSVPPLLLCESGGDNLAANFSRELADLTVYVIDVAGGDKVPRKGGPGITQSDILCINKIDLADAVGADLHVMAHDAARMRGGASSSHDDNATTAPTLFLSVKHGQGMEELQALILQHYQWAMKHCL